ncbi:hypothetical protein B7463_g3254, partial [Scytalidium lignicola]
MNIPSSMLRSVFSTSKKRYDPHTYQPIRLEENIEDCTDACNLGFKPYRCCLELDVSTSPYDTCVGCLTKMRQALAADGCSFTEINSRIGALLAGPGWKRSKMLEVIAQKGVPAEGTHDTCVSGEERKMEKKGGKKSAMINQRLEKWKKGVLSAVKKKDGEEEAALKMNGNVFFRPYMDSTESLVVITDF